MAGERGGAGAAVRRGALERAQLAQQGECVLLRRGAPGPGLGVRRSEQSTAQRWRFTVERVAVRVKARVKARVTAREGKGEGNGEGDDDGDGEEGRESSCEAMLSR